MRFKKGKTSKARRTCSFSLVELLVVIAILAALLSMLMPAMRRSQFKAQQLVCKNNLSQIGVAYSLYSDDHDYRYPTPVPGSYWPFGKMIAAGRPSAGALLYSESYLPEASHLYCPISEFVTIENGWNPQNFWVTYTGYSWLANYTRGDRTQYAQDPYSGPSTLIAIDIQVGEMAQQSLGRYNHKMGSSPEGGNLLFNDGRVEERNFEETSLRFVYHGEFYW
jgi:type II secretory pathway pseudopilin PulG